MLQSRFVLSGDRFTAHAAFTDRRGGYSAAAFDSFNLAHHVGDAEEHVAANRSMLATVLELQADRLSFVSQVHGTAVHRIDLPDPSASVPAPAVVADAQITTSADLGLVVQVADCTPVLLADVTAGVIGAVHAGRKGMADGVVPAALEAMAAAGAERITAVIGPSICPRCYEVPEELRAEVAAAEPVTASVSAHGTPALDVAAGVAEQLRRAGAAIHQWVPTCTAEDPGLYSYRRDGVTGRFAGVIWLRAH
ncbi:peptidoglycan editing factor PgeF [Nocardia zapadnayensis]|uniref:peptidoglycan editing factor PgeF n=1 Tax=Brevibacterium sp. R8603A2 TaxID=2929779 RepID=UPI001FF71390|nr:peptidoglycan editing factor PgeF [Nocardia zapadnayensis]MCK1804142.1 peptidoglycan editing factor PgeF [Brevibacterium sp. R8603A2]MCX0276622.1 peptidoglycan editing factor PgeF [Nocardia zapadnayensis]